MNPESYFWLIPLPPLAAFFGILLLTWRKRTLSHWLALAGAGLAFLGSLAVLWRAFSIEHLAEHPFGVSIDWLPAGSSVMRIGAALDPLGAVSLAFVAVTVLMIFIYSIGYHNHGQPEGKDDLPGLPPRGMEMMDEHGHTVRAATIEPMYSRFFALISLFAFAMFLLVLSDNLLTLYIGWEIMGLCSYLLIGFWYGRPSARDAAVKAFMTTRIGDAFMLLGLAALYSLTGTFRFSEILGSPQTLEILSTSASGVLGLSWAGLIGILLLMGTVGKSAQFPLHVWLPDAMEGPTPVSAMIHAATMVSAGVYLALRFFPLIAAGWQPGGPLTAPMLFIGAVGAFTALFAALIALGQDDIKRVLAYSTISQLGFMLAALGIGAYVAAAFHLVTHAFFKALLFLGSGSVIHGMEHGAAHSGEHLDPQNMKYMGGLAWKMPLTFAAFLAGGLSLAGFPLLTSGFWSKDEILKSAYGLAPVVFYTLAFAALLTAFYTARQLTLVFLGQPRSRAAEKAHESRPVMTWPLLILAVFALIGGLVVKPFEHFVAGMLPHELLVELPESAVPVAVSVAVALGGLLLGWLVYRHAAKGQPDPLESALGPLFRAFHRKFWVDEAYQAVILRPAAWLAETAVARWIDQVILDGILHAVGRFTLWLGELLRSKVDRKVFSGGGDALAAGAQLAGSQLSGLQRGRVQEYMAGGIAVLVLAGLMVLFFLNL